MEHSQRKSWVMLHGCGLVVQWYLRWVWGLKASPHQSGVHRGPGYVADGKLWQSMV
jgi:hypothetical protein